MLDGARVRTLPTEAEAEDESTKALSVANSKLPELQPPVTADQTID